MRDGVTGTPTTPGTRAGLTSFEVASRRWTRNPWRVAIRRRPSLVNKCMTLGGFACCQRERDSRATTDRRSHVSTKSTPPARSAVAA